ncbi:MAG TPA: hypothetical protein VF846_20275 [Thermoanaerobaculia bacterium]
MTARATIALLLTLAGCAEPARHEPKAQPAPAAPAAPIVTDRTRYLFTDGQFGREVTIISTLTAPPDRDIYLVNCNGAFTTGLQRQVAGKWENAWVASTNACFSQPIKVVAGARHTGTLIIRRGSGAVVNGRATDEALPPGTYRVIWHNVLTSYDPNDLTSRNELPIEQRVSAPIVLADR